MSRRHKGSGVQMADVFDTRVYFMDSNGFDKDGNSIAMYKTRQLAIVFRLLVGAVLQMVTIYQSMS